MKRKAKFWDQQPPELNDRQRTMLNKVLDGFEGKLTSSRWAKICKCSSDTAIRDINAWVQQGKIVKELGGGSCISYGLEE